MFLFKKATYVSGQDVVNKEEHCPNWKVALVLRVESAEDLFDKK